MSMRLNRGAYAALADEDIAWLRAQPRTLEREHVIAVVEASKEFCYPEKYLEDAALLAKLDAALSPGYECLPPRLALSIILGHLGEVFNQRPSP